jgi:DNA-binding response OmpR family regulator
MAIMEATAHARGNAGSVVILCAEETIRAAIAYWSTHLPVRTIVADDGYHANRVLQTDNCRLLVTDRVLPPWPGLDTFRRLRARNPELRIAFVEGVAREDIGLAKVTGATDVLARPLCRQSVADTIDAAMRPS